MKHFSVIATTLLMLFPVQAVTNIEGDMTRKREEKTKRL